MRELGMNLPVLGGDAFITDDFAKLVGDEIMEGIIAASSFIPTADTPKVRKFVADYRAKFGNTPEDHASPLYDGVYILAEAMKRAGTTSDREKINVELSRTNGFEGVDGVHTADKWNNLLHSCMLAEYKNGGWVYLDILTGLEDHDD
jgi:branched-chain amino acid transport system substrate-binding protein